MTSEKQLLYICTVQRGLGIVEGIASNMADDAVKTMLYTAAEMIDEAVQELTAYGKEKSAPPKGD